jgi:hypothetical protein
MDLCWRRGRKISEGAMTAPKKTIGELLGVMFRMLDSVHEGEALNTIAAMKRVVTARGFTFSDIAVLLENWSGEEIEAKKYSDTEAEAIYTKGIEKGRAERPQQEPTEFFDGNNQPQWHAIALYCQRHYERLEQKHREFIDDMAGNTVWRTPTEKQGKYLLSMFYRLGRGKLQ